MELSGHGGGGATALEAGASIGGEVVVLAVHYSVIADVVRQYGDQLAGKTVIDIANPAAPSGAAAIDFDAMDGLATLPERSSAEETAELVPDGTPVVKAFNTTFGNTLVSGEVAGHQLDVLIAGDDEQAKERVAELVRGWWAEAH